MDEFTKVWIKANPKRYVADMTCHVNEGIGYVEHTIPDSDGEFYVHVADDEYSFAHYVHKNYVSFDDPGLVEMAEDKYLTAALSVLDLGLTLEDYKKVQTVAAAIKAAL